jgi:predicted ArsR family transcriptional regulator
MRANKRESVGAADLTSAWEAVFSEMAAEDWETYRSEGWLRSEDVLKQFTISSHAVRFQLDRMVQAGKLERKKIRLNRDGVTRSVNIYRPRT